MSDTNSKSRIEVILIIASCMKSTLALASSPSTNSNRTTLGQKLADGANEVRNLSAFALTLIIGPIIALIILIAIFYCICSKIAIRRRRRHEEPLTDFLGIPGLKAPPGQPPIPLTGMVNNSYRGLPKLSATATPTAQNGGNARLI